MAKVNPLGEGLDNPDDLQRRFQVICTELDVLQIETVLVLFEAVGSSPSIEEIHYLPLPEEDRIQRIDPQIVLFCLNYLAINPPKPGNTSGVVRINVLEREIIVKKAVPREWIEEEGEEIGH